MYHNKDFTILLQGNCGCIKITFMHYKCCCLAMYNKRCFCYQWHYVCTKQFWQVYGKYMWWNVRCHYSNRTLDTIGVVENICLCKMPYTDKHVKVFVVFVLEIFLGKVIANKVIDICTEYTHRHHIRPINQDDNEHWKQKKTCSAYEHSLCVSFASSICIYIICHKICGQYCYGFFCRYMSPESYEKIWKENFLLSGIHCLV